MIPLRFPTGQTHGRLSPANLLLRRTAAAAWLCIASPAITAGAAPPPLTDNDRLDGLVKFAETLLKHARDTYGEKHTPLIPNYLEVDTLKAPQQEYITRVGGPGPRSKVAYQPAIASNLAYQGNL